MAHFHNAGLPPRPMNPPTFNSGNRGGPSRPDPTYDDYELEPGEERSPSWRPGGGGGGGGGRHDYNKRGYDETGFDHYNGGGEGGMRSDSMGGGYDSRKRGRYDDDMDYRRGSPGGYGFPPSGGRGGYRDEFRDDFRGPPQGDHYGPPPPDRRPFPAGPDRYEPPPSRPFFHRDPPHGPQGGDGQDGDRWPRGQRQGNGPPRGGDERFDRPTQPPSPPSQSVIFLGLPGHLDADGLRSYLESLGAVIDSTTIIYDKQTGLSKRYGFAKFGSVEHARAFVEPNWPTIAWKDNISRDRDGTVSETLRVKIDYSQSQEKGPKGALVGSQGQGAMKAPMGPNWEHDAFPLMKPQDSGYHLPTAINDGTRDIGMSPTQILLLRNLDPLTAEEEIYDALAKVSVPGIRTGLRQVRLIKDRMTRGSWGFAFVQFRDVQMASQALAAAMDPKAYPTGFRIRQQLVALSFSHETSFVPVYSKSEWSFRGEGGQELCYWDDNAYSSTWQHPSVKAEIQTGRNKGSSSATTQKAGPESAADGLDEDADMAAFLSSIESEHPSKSSASPAGALSETPSSTMPETKKTTINVPPPAISAPPVVDKPASTTEAVKPMGKIKIKPLAQTESATVPAKDKKKGSTEQFVGARRTAATINKWNAKKEELKQGTEPELETSIATPLAPAASSSSTIMDTTSLDLPDFEYGDSAKMTCLLCMRQFKTIADLKKHNDVSTLHKGNLQDPEKCKTAKSRKESTLQNQPSTSSIASTAAALVQSSTSTQEQPKYRDRASERREAFGQPDAPVPESKGRRFAEGPAPPPPPPPQPNKDGIESSNVGSKMLEAMGWSKGSGLGAASGGRVDPIQAYMHNQGVGLGASKGVVAGKYEDSSRGYAQSIKDKARERLNAESRTDTP